LGGELSETGWGGFVHEGSLERALVLWGPPCKLLFFCDSQAYTRISTQAHQNTHQRTRTHTLRCTRPSASRALRGTTTGYSSTPP